VREIAARLTAAGHVTALVGGSVRDGLLGRLAPDFDLATSAAPDATLALFPRAIPIGLRHGTVMIPSAARPVDVTQFRGASLREDLGRRDFTINAMALELCTPPVLLDPTGGHHDLAAGVLRCPGDPHERLAEDPLRTVRAARFVAELGVEPDPALRAALPDHAAAVTGVAGERIRVEIERLMLGPHVERGLALLRDIGAERLLVPGVRADAARIAGAVAPQLLLRLTAWLRDTQAGTHLRKLRFSRRVVETVERRVAAHPASEWTPGPAALRKQRRRLGDDGLTALLALARAELEAAQGDPNTAAAVARLTRVETALAELRRSGSLDVERATLTVHGGDVMRWLGCAPGPDVGRALRWLIERVAEDPTRNEPATLRALLRDYAAAGPGDAIPRPQRGSSLDAPGGEG
jgi:tRNA nucleotidyltransferase/poly(A) polymerase